MSHRLLIRDADVVLPNQVCQANVLVEDHRIVGVGVAREHSCHELIEGAGLTLMPGVIDDQVHFRDPGMTHKEDIESGSQACAAGGVTTYLEMPNTKPPAIDCESLARKYSRAAEVSRVNFGFYIGATADNIDQLRQATHAPGIKIFIGSSTGNLLVDEQAALEEIFGRTSLPICAHCEDESTVLANRRALGDALEVADHSRIRDEQAALVSTRRVVDLAVRHHHRFHVLHVSTAAEIPVIVEAAPYVTAEVCPHHLFFTTEDYPRLGSLIQMNPSVKSPENPPQLWQALLDNRIQVIATDHAPHTLEEKQLPYPQSPSGLPAVENSLALMLNEVNQGKCTLNQVAGWMSDAPARIWGLVGKGRIQSGYAADLVLVDMQNSNTVCNSRQWTRSKWSPWDGVTLQGWPVRTIVGGKTVFQDGLVSATQRGRAVRCDHARGGYFATPDGIGLE